MTQLLELYSRCLKAVEGKGAGEIASSNRFAWRLPAQARLAATISVCIANSKTAGLGVALVAAVEPDAARAVQAAEKYAIPVFSTVDELLKADLKIECRDRCGSDCASS